MKNIFNTSRKESINSKLRRMLFNFFPCYRRSGGKVIFFSEDFQEVQIKIKFNWQTKNYVGSIYGGSLYSAIDPIYMLQLLWILGKNYVVWDKSACIKFIKPAKTIVYAQFEITNQLIKNIKDEVQLNGYYTFELPVNIVDKNSTIYAIANKELYVADKSYYKKQQTIKKSKTAQ